MTAPDEKRRAPAPRARFAHVLLMLALIPTTIFVVGEVLVRATGVGSTNQRILYRSTLLKGKPYATYVNTKENTNTVRLNNWGFHDADHEAQSAQYRVAFLGDSMVEAVQVPADRSFTALVGARFAREAADVEIINAGASGTGTGYQYLLWREFFDGSKKVDHVVLCLFMGNDLEDNSRVLGSTPTNFGVYVTPAGGIDINRVQFSLPQRVVRTLTDYSALVNTVYTRLYLIRRQMLAGKRAEERAAAPDAAPDAAKPAANTANTAASVAATTAAPQVAVDPAKDSVQWDETIDGTLRLIDRWASEVRGKQLGFSIVLLHAPEESSAGRYRHPRKQQFVERLRALGGTAHIGLLELGFDDRDPIGIYSFDGKTLGHFNYEGHRAAADRLYPWLRSQIEEHRRTSGASRRATLD